MDTLLKDILGELKMIRTVMENQANPAWQLDMAARMQDLAENRAKLTVIRKQ